MCKVILHGKLLGFHKRVLSGQSSSPVLQRMRNTPPTPSSPAAMLPQPGHPLLSPAVPVPLTCPLSTPYLAPGRPRAGVLGAHPAPLSAGRDNAKMDNAGAGVNGRGSGWWREEEEVQGPALPVPALTLAQLCPAGAGSCPPGARRIAQRRRGCPMAGLSAGRTRGRRLAPIPCPPRAAAERLCWEGAAGLMSPRCIHPFPPSGASILPAPLVGCPHHFGPFYRSPSCGSGCHHRHAFMRVGLCKACIKCSQKYEVLSFVKLIKMSKNFYKGKMSHWMAHFSLLAFYN